MKILRQYPIPIAGLILSLFALGNLAQSYGQQVRLGIGGIALILYLIYLLKLIVLNVKLRESLENPVAASVFPTFTMATMLLAGYLKPCFPLVGDAIGYAGVAGHALLIVWFSMKFLRNFSIKKVFPSWFIVYVGIAVASVTAPVMKQPEIGKGAFWFAFVSYFCLLPVVCRRVWGVGEIPEPAKPTAVIFAAPASLLLAGYMAAFKEKQAGVVFLLLAFSLLFYAVGLFYLFKFCKMPFSPGFSAFTFPLVISALATKLTGGYLAGTAFSGAVMGLYRVQEAVAFVVVAWVLVGYLRFLFSGGDGL